MRLRTHIRVPRAAACGSQKGPKKDPRRTQEEPGKNPGRTHQDPRIQPPGTLQADLTQPIARPPHPSQPRRTGCRHRTPRLPKPQSSGNSEAYFRSDPVKVYDRLTRVDEGNTLKSSIPRRPPLLAPQGVQGIGLGPAARGRQHGHRRRRRQQQRRAAVEERVGGVELEGRAPRPWRRAAAVATDSHRPSEQALSPPACRRRRRLRG